MGTLSGRKDRKVGWMVGRSKEKKTFCPEEDRTILELCAAVLHTTNVKLSPPAFLNNKVHILTNNTFEIPKGSKCSNMRLSNS